MGNAARANYAMSGASHRVTLARCGSYTVCDSALLRGVCVLRRQRLIDSSLITALLPLGALEVLLGLAVLLFTTLLEIVVALGRHGFLVVEVKTRGGNRGPSKLSAATEAWLSPVRRLSGSVPRFWTISAASSTTSARIRMWGKNDTARSSIARCAATPISLSCSMRVTLARCDAVRRSQLPSESRQEGGRIPPQAPRESCRVTLPWSGCRSPALNDVRPTRIPNE